MLSLKTHVSSTPKTRSGLRLRLLVTHLMLLIAGLPTIAQQVSFKDLHVEKKPGKQVGPAVVTVNGKPKHLATHALQAWTVMNGQNALVLVLHAKSKAPDEYHLRFYDGQTRKYRNLGVVPFATAELIEAKQSDGSWAFVLSGSSDGKPVIVVAGLNGVHGRLDGARSPKLEQDSLSFTGLSSQTQTLPIEALLARDMTAIYQTQSGQYVQFLRDGSAAIEESGGNFQTGIWRTDGERMIVREKNGSEVPWPLTSLTAAKGVPAGMRLAVRLLEPLASEKVKEGDSVSGVLVSPATIDNSILLPQGCEFTGTITQAHGVGWGIKHETAAFTLEFNIVKLPDGASLPIPTQLYQVENSREAVNSKGKVQGVRSTGTPGHSAESKIASVAALDPVGICSQQAQQPQLWGLPSLRFFIPPVPRFSSSSRLL